MSAGWVELVETPAGWVIASGSERLESLSFPFAEREAALWAAGAEFPDVLPGAPTAISRPLSAFLDDFFSGRPPEARVPLSLESLTAFTQRVLEETARIPWGTISTYGEIAERLGSPRAARAVGQALGRNPIPIVVPCHRVVAQGSIGGFGSGLCWKRRLLALEGIEMEKTSGMAGVGEI